MSNRLKPIPRNQSQVTQQALPEPYLPSRGKPISETVFSQNRGTDYSLKDDKVKDISVGLEDIDNAIMYYFEKVIKPTVIQNGQQIAVPILYGSPERWKSVQADGFYRDNSGRMLVPLIMFKRETVEKNRTLTNKLDGNTAHLYQVVGEKYNKRNAYDQFDILNNRVPSEQYYITPVPDYLTLTYNCIIFTDFVEQNNKIVEAVEFASDSYWGDPARWKFRAAIDSFATTTLLEEGTDRSAKSNFSIKVNGYILPNTVNKDLATARSKFYTKAQVIFTMETATSKEILNTTSKAAPKTAMGSAVGVADSYNVNLTTNTNITVSGSVLAEYLNSNKQVTATTVTAPDTVIFPNGWATVPSPLPALLKTDFTFFVNGQFIEPAAVTSFTNNGSTSTLVVNTSALGFSLTATDEIISIGKFA